MTKWEMLDMLDKKDEHYFNLVLESLENSKLATTKGEFEESNRHMALYDKYRAKLEAVREIKNEVIRSL